MGIQTPGDDLPRGQRYKKRRKGKRPFAASVIMAREKELVEENKRAKAALEAKGE